MPQGIHVAHVPIDAAIGWKQEDGSRWHRLAGTTVDDNMADRIELLKLTFSFIGNINLPGLEIVLRPWVENW